MKYGPNKVIATVYRHGAPPTIGALAALLDDDARDQVWKTYVADIGCTLVKMRARKSRISYYSEIVAKSNHTYDSRSGQEIVDSIVAKRKKRRAAKGSDAS